MNLRKSLITSGSALTLLLASGCQTSNPTYTSTKNPYLLGRNDALPPVTMDPNTGAPVASETLPTPLPEPETQGLGQLEVIDAQDTNQAPVDEIPPLVIEEPKPEPTRYHTVKKGDTLSEIALMYGISYKTLASENNMSTKKSLRIGQKLKLPAGASAKADKSSLKKGKPTGKTVRASSKDGTYKVKNGENLWTIPKKFGIKRSDFMSANRFSKSTVLQIGQTVIIPGKPGNHTSSSKKSSRSKQTVTYNTGASASGNSYTVKNGDNPWTIAKKLKVRHSDLMSVNNLTSSSMLKIGQVLSVPGEKSSSNTPDIAPTATVATEPAIGLDPSATPTESTDAPLIVEATETPAVDEPASDAKKEHITYPYDVMEGDTLENLTTIHNTTVDELKKHNPTIKSNEDLKPGISISIPFKD
jgi:LysM repeat protein